MYKIIVISILFFISTNNIYSQDFIDSTSSANLKMNNHIPLSISISMSEKLNTYSNKRRFEPVWYYKTKYKNNTNDTIFIADYIMNSPYFLSINYFDKYKAMVTFSIEEFSDKYGWEKWSMPKLSNELQYQRNVFDELVLHKIKPLGEVEIEELLPIKFIAGRYKIIKSLGVKISDDAFLIISSNEIEITVEE